MIVIAHQISNCSHPSLIGKILDPVQRRDNGLLEKNETNFS